MITSSLPILFQDDHLIAIDKPYGMSVAPSESDKDVTVAEIITEQLGIPLERAGIIHRLDKDTSGVLLVAKSQEMLDLMQGLFKRREVHKTYTALVHAAVAEDKGVVRAPIARNPQNREKFGVFEGGRDSETVFEVDHRLTLPFAKIEEMLGAMTKKEKNFYMKDALDYCLLKLHPKTGRTHQIRVHMKYIHHPIVGDEVYTGKKLYRFDNRWCTRQFLHASTIEFEHPINRSQIKIDSPLAQDLVTALEFLTS
ncbi:MAG: RluA family pseudouridine synthase [bacterium]|nr:RluA family pseudouridine synthase [bacterium]